MHALFYFLLLKWNERPDLVLSYLPIRRIYVAPLYSSINFLSSNHFLKIKHAIFIIYYEETAATKKLIEVLTTPCDFF